jgi:hypothetical protein
MSISLYKPNSKNAGCAFNFKIGVNRNKEPVVYVSAIQQYSWDDKKKSGNFSGNKDDPDKNINLKFSEFEIGGIISSFRKRYEYSAFHSYEDNKTSIKFVPWDKQSKTQNGTITLPAFGITFTRNGNQSFRIPLEPGEVENLDQFLKFYLKELYSHRRREEIKNIQKYKKDQQEETNNVKGTDEAPF